MQGHSEAISAGDVKAPGWAEWLLSAVAVLIAYWPSRAPWAALHGSPLGETDNHLWMMWLAVRRALGDGRVLVNAPEGMSIPLMDPVNLPAFLAFWPLGPTLAWAGLLAWNVGLAFVGGAALAREVAGPRAASFGALATAAAPFLVGVVDFGITESWTVGWLALHVALLLRYARLGQARWAVGAGLCLGFVALSGWYSALFGLIAEAMLVPALLWRTRRPGLVLQGGIGLVMVIPALMAFLPSQGLWKSRWHPPPLGPGPFWPDWATLPRMGTDALNLLLPSLDTVAPSKAVYLGTVLLALVALGLARAPRRAGVMVALALPFLLLALGAWPRVAGHPVGLRGPAWWLATLVPSLQGLSHWHRAVGAAIPFLAAAAAVGVDRWLGTARLRGLAMAALLVDGVAFSQTPWPRPAYDPEVEPGLMALGEPLAENEGIIQLPFDNGRVEFSDEPARLFNRWQVFHQHPVAENYEGADTLLRRSRLVAAADGACGVRFTGPRPYQPNEALRRAAMPTQLDVLDPEVGQLVTWGYRWVALHVDRAVTPERCLGALEAALGPGERRGGVYVWDLFAWMDHEDD